jgi:hypothetical protein
MLSEAYGSLFVKRICSTCGVVVEHGFLEDAVNAPVIVSTFTAALLECEKKLWPRMKLMVVRNGFPSVSAVLVCCITALLPLFSNSCSELSGYIYKSIYLVLPDQSSRRVKYQLGCCLLASYSQASVKMPISGRRRNKVKGVQFTIMVVGASFVVIRCLTLSISKAHRELDERPL